MLSPINTNEFRDLRYVIQALGKDSAALDGSDSQTEGTWLTSTGVNVPFLEWQLNTHDDNYADEPNGGTAENCLDFGKDKLMNDASCSHKVTVICEKPVNSG